MDNYRRMAFSEEVVAYLDAAVINSHVILAYLCVWAGERLGGDGRAGTVLPALSPPRPTQSRVADTERTFQYTVKDCLAVGPNQFTPPHRTRQNCRACGTPPRQTRHRHCQTGQFCRV